MADNYSKLMLLYAYGSIFFYLVHNDNFFKILLHLHENWLTYQMDGVVQIPKKNLAGWKKSVF